MSTFQDTKPVGGVRFLIGTLVTAVIVFSVAAFGQYFLIQSSAAKSTAKKVAALELEAITKFANDAKKKLPKGEKVDDAKLKADAAVAFRADAKAVADFNKKSAEAKHHAEGGLFPLSVFTAIASGLCGGLYGTILLVKRFKDANVGPWLGFFGHVFSLCFYMFVAFVPVLLYLAHHVEGGFAGFYSSSIFVKLPCYLASLGLLTILVAIVLPHSKRAAHAHDHH